MDDDFDGSMITCEVAWVLIQGFVSGDSTPGGERMMRAHTALCSECRDEYRSAVVTTARIGGEKRRQRIEDERDSRHERLRRMALQASVPAPGKSHRLRTLLYPAFFAFLMFQVSRFSVAAAGVSITGLAGQVTVREEGLDMETHRTLYPGDRCETGAHSSARIDAYKSALVLGPSSALLVEATRPARYRFERGHLEIDGSCAVQTRWGIVELNGGRARVTVQPDGLEVENLQGQVQLLGAAGVISIAPEKPYQTWQSEL